MILWSWWYKRVDAPEVLMISVDDAKHVDDINELMILKC